MVKKFIDSNEGLLDGDQSVNQAIDSILLQLLLMLPSAQENEEDIILSNLEQLDHSQKQNLLVDVYTGLKEIIQDNRSLKMQLQAYETNADALNNTIKNDTFELNSLHELLRKEKSKLEQLQTEHNFQLSMDVSQANHAKYLVESKIKSLEDQVLNSDMEIYNQHNLINELSTKIIKLKDDLSTAKNEILVNDENHELLKKSHAEQIDLIKKTNDLYIKELTQDILNLRNTLESKEDLNEINMKLNLRLQSMQIELDKFKSIGENFKIKSRDLNEVVEGLKTELQEANLQLDGMKLTLESNAIQYNDHIEIQKHQEQVMESMENKITSLVTTVTTLKDSAHQKDQEIIRLRAELNAMNAQQSLVVENKVLISISCKSATLSENSREEKREELGVTEIIYSKSGIFFKLSLEGDIATAVLTTEGAKKTGEEKDDLYKQRVARTIIDMIDHLLDHGDVVDVTTENPFQAVIASLYINHLKHIAFSPMINNSTVNGKNEVATNPEATEIFKRIGGNIDKRQLKDTRWYKAQKLSTEALEEEQDDLLFSDCQTGEEDDNNPGGEKPNN